MILEITSYYPKDGQAEAVLAHRQAGCALRAKMGLEPGSVFALFEGEGAPVRWLCRYPDEAALRADLAARRDTPAFREQVAGMSALIERFERSIYRLAD